MSHTDRDRKIQSNFGNQFPRLDSGSALSSAEVAGVVARALRQEFGETHAAIKLVVGLTQANERAVKNWFLAKNGPDGPHLVTLMRYSDQVLQAVLIMAARKELLTTKKLLDARRTLEGMLKLLDELQ